MTFETASSIYCRRRGERAILRVVTDMAEKGLNFITIDFETANYAKESACAVGLVRFVDGREEDGVYSLIRPPSTYFIPEWTETIHHISYEDVCDKPRFPDVWRTLVEPFLGQTPGLPLVAHNTPFDMNIIRGCCAYYDMELPDVSYFCSLALSRIVWPGISHRLTALGEHFGICYDAHNALADAQTCGKVVVIAAQELGVADTDSLLKKAGIPLCSLRERSQHGG